MNSLKTNLRFCVVYPGPVDTNALVGKWPFTKRADEMASYMIRSVLKSKTHCEPHLFYSLLVRLLHLLPPKWAIFILRQLFQ